MTTLSSLPREVLKWLLSLNLSFPVHNVKRDFSNGFLFAEVLSRYYPSDIDMHSFENVTSIERKRANWVVLEKLFKRRNIPVEPRLVEAVMLAEGDAASEVLQLLYAFINSDAYTQASPVRRSSSSNARRASMEADKAQPGGTEGYPYGSLEEAAMVAWQQQIYFHQKMAMAEALTPTSKKKHMGALTEQLQAAAAVDPSGILSQQLEALAGAGSGGGGISEELAFSKKPRPIKYRPYGIRDYAEGGYDVKKAQGYWQLGRLGPENENVELQAKRERNERIKQLARQINATNQERLSSAGSGSAGSSSGSGRPRPEPKEPSARERAVDYARSSVPRPEPAKRKPRSAGGPGEGPQGRGEVSQAESRLERLQEQHDADSQAVEAIRRELERSLGVQMPPGTSDCSSGSSGPAPGGYGRLKPSLQAVSGFSSRKSASMHRGNSRGSGGSRGTQGSAGEGISAGYIDAGDEGIE